MNPLSYGFVSQAKQDFHINGKVLDIGSKNINGTVRPIFFDCEYIGLDMSEGDNVDIVCNSHSLPYPDNTMDCVVSVGTLEHDDKFWLTIEEVKRVLKPGGYGLFTVPSIGFPKHDYPHDYWRFTTDAFESMFDGWEKQTTPAEMEVVCWAIKPQVKQGSKIAVERRL